MNHYEVIGSIPQRHEAHKVLNSLLPSLCTEQAEVLCLCGKKIKLCATPLLNIFEHYLLAYNFELSLKLLI